MNARSRRERAILRERRRAGWMTGWAGTVRRRSIARQTAAGIYPFGDVDRSLVRARLNLLFRQHGISDGVAYVPATSAPINAAYWLYDDDPHTQDGECPACGPCEKCDAECQSCHCCRCRAQREEEA